MAIRRPQKRSLVPLGLVMASLLASLLLLEAGLRVVMPGQNVAWIDYDAELGWRGTPHAGFLFARSLFAVEVKHNAEGFRDRSRTVAGPGDSTRILCRGDSFTWGWGVEQDSIYTHLLEERFIEHSLPVEVINRGVCGQNTVQALLDLLYHGFDYEPDVVIYQVADNDVGDNLPPPLHGLWKKPYFVLDEGGALTLQGYPVAELTFVERIKYHLPRHSRLVYYLRDRMRTLRARSAARETAGDPVEQSEPAAVAYPFRLFCALVNRMNEECRARDARLLVLMDFTLDDRRTRYWEETCGGVDAHCIADYLRMREDESGVSAYAPTDGHWTDRGHRWVAEYLFEVLAPELPLPRDWTR